MKPYYERDGITIYHGDCLDVMPSISHVGAIVTDPPYALPTMVAQGRGVTRNAGDLSIVETAFRVHSAVWKRSLSPDGRCFVFCDGTSYPSIFRATFSDFSTALIVWSKGRIGMGRDFRKSHELILHCWLPETPVVTDGVGRSDVLDFKSVPSEERLHPAEKPVALIHSLLSVCSGLVVDPFMGSGSTLIAAREANRRAVGIEMEERYCEVAAKRLSQGLLPLSVGSSIEGTKAP